MRYLLTACALACLAGPALADTAITGVTGGNTFDQFTSGTTTIGWTFSLNSAVRVTALGWHAVDNGSTGGAIGTLDSSHQVGIWQGTTLLGSAVVTAGAGNPFRYASISGLDLAPGIVYTIAGADTDTDGDGYITGATSIATSSIVNFLGSAASAGGDGFTAPTAFAAGSRGRFGANFQFDVAGGVPEPATWGMMILGFGLAGAAMRRRSSGAVLA